MVIGKVTPRRTGGNNRNIVLLGDFFEDLPRLALKDTLPGHQDGTLRLTGNLAPTQGVVPTIADGAKSLYEPPAWDAGVSSRRGG